MDDEHARQLLAAERRRLEEAAAEIDEPEDAGTGDEAETLSQEELDATLADDLRPQLEALERAEARLAAGTYGLSVESGKPIPDARLEANPTAERTVEEQERQERLGGA